MVVLEVEHVVTSVVCRNGGTDTIALEVFCDLKGNFLSLNIYGLNQREQSTSKDRVYQCHVGDFAILKLFDGICGLRSHWEGDAGCH